MRWLRRLLPVALLLVLGGLLYVAGSTLLALDWDRRHTAQTAELPVLGPGGPDVGIVRVEANGLTFRARVAGMENTGPALVLLHGFPETSAMWRPLIEAAAAAGFRVVAFDQRGYSPGARPESIDDYRLTALVDDVIAVADAAGFDAFHLVGHDWGCVVGWTVAIEHPDRVLSWSGLSIPHPGTLLANLRDEVPSYIRLFTAPLVPETMLGMNDFAWLREGSYADAPAEQRNEYLRVFAEPGALTSALNWYRALMASLADADSQPVTGPVEVPTLFIYGDREMWVTADALELQQGLVNAPYEVLELRAGHFVMRDQPRAVTAAVLQQIGGVAGGNPTP